MKIIILQPPTTQFNTVYPSGAYLSSFFRQIQKNDFPEISSVKWIDLNIQLFHNIFSSSGLKVIFELSKERAIKKIQKNINTENDELAFQLQRFLMNQQKWINWIDNIVEILQCKNSSRELCHEFIFSPHRPLGARMENFLSQKKTITIDDARLLASFAIADIADYITVCFDNNFSLVRYAEHIATSETDFNNFLISLKSPIIKHFFANIVKNFLQHLPKEEPILFCISIPFPGCFTQAMYLAQQIKLWSTQNQTKSIIAIGGGYCSTELRQTTEPKLKDFVDFISYDRGYATYYELLSRLQNTKWNKQQSLSASIYNAKIFFTEEPSINDNSINDNSITNNSFAIFDEAESKKIDTFFTTSVFPDYQDIDFSAYPKLCDDENPMHRIWSDGSWLKAYLAHGCYWHRCTFCDTSLDYVNGYKMIDTQKLYNHLVKQAQKTQTRGIHFVDEAAPPVSLKNFALCNINSLYKLTFWGNIRFEKNFTPDLCNLLSFGGLTAVSGGIEIATGDGLLSVNKGTDIESIVCALCGFKEAGILVHAYMIFGFYDETEQGLIDSIETLRQLFLFGLIDSAFWHKFTLTRHSTLYKKWQEGKCKDLKPVIKNQKNLFANNDIHFQDEHKSNKYSAPLHQALNNWMHGQNLQKKVTSYFPFKMPKPSINEDFIEKIINKYEQKKLAYYDDYQDYVSQKAKYLWIGDTPFFYKNKLNWIYQNEFFECNASEEDYINLINLSPKLNKKIFKYLRGKGLCKI